MKDGAEQQNLDVPDEDQNVNLARLFNRYKSNNKLITSISLAGVILFLLIALAFPFRDRIFDTLYPKPKSQASSCSGISQIPANKAGFVFTGGDLEQAITALQTSLYNAYDLNLGPKKSFYVIGKYAQNEQDPLNLRLLMENNLGNTDFKGLSGQAPAGWNIIGGGQNVLVDTDSENMNGKTSLKLVSQGNSETQVSQTFKKNILPGQYVVFGTWVKAARPEDIKVIVQNSQSPNQEFGSADVSQIEPNKWTYVVGFGKVPADVTNFQIALKSSGNAVWFNGMAGTIINNEQNQAITNLVLERCGSAWMIDDGPGWEQSSSSPFIKPLTPEVYSLIYNQYYSQIKNVDSSAKIIPGSLMGAPVVFDGKSGYSPQAFLDGFRSSYKNFFGSEPPIDALAIRYLATEQKNWSSVKDFEDYLIKLRNYMDNIPEWKGKPIWITRLGVSNNAPSGGVEFLQAVMKFLINNTLNIEKWFWYDTCGLNSQMASLFISNNKICTWPMKLSPLGQEYILINATPTPLPTPTQSPLSTQSPTSLPVNSSLVPSSTPIQTPVPETPVSSESANIKEGTNSGSSQ